ncbi:unnamed protein product [Mytilus coruscus]|uniref:Ig-like domain-containing protein n=1 Tax=Mytilus coruscus TaxID=42192 RepID=A0A6J8CCX6_MYTCO|nr:unnamed protein product [Mytilus coruscus]
MEIFLSLLLIGGLLSCFTTQAFVTLSGNLHVKRFGNVRLNCSSNNTPIANTASIQIDGKSYTTITLMHGGCFSSVLRTKCTPDECVCSNQGLWYSHTYKVVQPVGVVNFKCLMTFKAYGSFSDSINVKIIDFIGPTITTEPRLPVQSDSNVVLTCMVETLSTKITFEWECLGKVEPRSRRVSISNSTTYSSVIRRNIDVIHDGATCKCCVKVDGIVGNFEISLAISRKPIIDISKASTCESSSAVTLYCIINTGFPLFGFTNWIHSRHDTLIRHLEGEKMHTKSLLKFNSCSHDDTGDYTCEAYNEYGGNTTFANKTVSLIVYASPVIISSDVIHEQQTTLSATFYSSTEMVLTWNLSNQTLTNSTDQLQTLDRNKIELILYNKSIECDGYIANLSIRSSLVGEYVLLIQNTFGETRLFFEVNKLSTQDVIYIIGPNERCPTIPIYHSAPALDHTQNVYAIPETGYLQVTNEQYELDHLQDHENKGVENYTSRYITIKHGIQYESVEKFESITKPETIKCGVFLSKSLSFLAASPGGLTENNTVLEIKCPYISQNELITPKSVHY